MRSDDPNLKQHYRMPRVFGALAGPRNVPKDKQHLMNRQRAVTLSVTARSDAKTLAELLPPACELQGEPTITVEVTFLTNIGWLAGRGYNIVALTIPIAHQSATRGRLTGLFMPVLWENLADPIITGREELGFAKIYAEIPDPIVIGDSFAAGAAWGGFRFLEICATQLQEAPLRIAPATGQFHYKFIPRTGNQREADVEYLEYSAPSTSMTSYGGMQVERRQEGRGSFKFHHARWEDVPLQYPIINALAELPILHWLEASVTYSSASGSIGDISAGELKAVE